MSENSDILPRMRMLEMMMGGIESLIPRGDFELFQRRISDVVEDVAHKLHLGIFSSQTAAKFHQRPAGQIIVIAVDVQRISPADIETEFVQGFLIAHVV